MTSVKTIKASSLLDLSLFLGIEVTSSLLRHLRGLPEPFLEYYTKGGEYLMELTHEGKLFLGKNVSKQLDLEEVEILHAHVFSLLKKVLPEAGIRQEDLVLFGH